MLQSRAIRKFVSSDSRHGKDLWTRTIVAQQDQDARCFFFFAEEIFSSVGVEFRRIVVISSAPTILARQPAHNPKCFSGHTSGYHGRTSPMNFKLLPLGIYPEILWLPKSGGCAQTYEQ